MYRYVAFDVETPNRYNNRIRKTLRMLEQIAMDADYGLELRGGIEGRNNDTEDFPEVSILAIQAMLEKAYLLGKADAQKTSH